MTRWMRVLMGVLGAGAALALVGPFLVPVPPLQDAVTARAVGGPR